MMSKTFIGGPCDGLPIIDDDLKHLDLTIAFQHNRVAFYLRNSSDDGFDFVTTREATEAEKQRIKDRAGCDYSKRLKGAVNHE